MLRFDKEDLVPKHTAYHTIERDFRWPNHFCWMIQNLIHNDRYGFPLSLECHGISWHAYPDLSVCARQCCYCKYCRKILLREFLYSLPTPSNVSLPDALLVQRNKAHKTDKILLCSSGAELHMSKDPIAWFPTINLHQDSGSSFWLSDLSLGRSRNLC